MRSIRIRALVGAVVTGWTVFAVLAAIDYRTTRDLLVFNFDDELRTHAGTLASLVHKEGDRLVLELDEEALPFYRSSPKAEYFEVWDAIGNVMRRSESLGGSDLPVQLGTPGEPHFADVRLPDGRPGRAIAVRYARGADVVGIAVAEASAPLDDAMAELVVSSVWTAAGLGLALAALLWLVLRAGLRPLGELSAKVARLDVARLPANVGMGAVPAEIAPVVARLDDLLARVRALVERERRVTSNVAHELMTPVAELRALTDVAIRFPDDGDYQRRATAATNQIAIRMQSVAEKVLELAAAESGGAVLACEPTDVAAMLRDAAAGARARAGQRDVELVVDAPDELVAGTDPIALRVVLDNLAQNAAEHAPAGTTVQVALQARDDVLFTFRNAAPELAATDLPQLTEPYWRKDAARSPGGTPHAGIGLALARELAERLGGDLSLRLDGGALTVTLRLRHVAGPAKPASDVAADDAVPDAAPAVAAGPIECPAGPLCVPAAPSGSRLALSLVIPTYEERDNIGELVRRLTSLLEPLLGASYELIVVDDDSPDRTWEVAAALAAEHPRLRVIRRRGERGLSTAVIRGWQAARGDVLGVIDADLQHPPEIAAALWHAIRGADLAVGSRHVEDGGVSDWSMFRRSMSRGAQLLGLILLPGVLGRVSDPMSGCFFVRRSAIAGVELDPVGYKILIEVIGRGRVRSIEEVGYVFRERVDGVSKVSWRVYVDYLRHLARLRVTNLHVRRFLRFAIVGGSGVLVDMAVLFVLSDPRMLGLGLTRSKLAAAELAIVNNFLWNDAWTFRDLVGNQRGLAAKLHRFVKFNLVCGLGLLLNVLLLNVMFNLLHMNRYVANLIAIGLVTLWNYWVNVKLHWRSADARAAS